MNKILGIVFALLFVLNAFLAGKSIVDSGKGQDALKDAVFIENGVVDEANEGKLVVVTGPIQTTDEAYDDVTELTLESALAAKHTETLSYDYIDKETNKKAYDVDHGLSTMDFNNKYRVEENWTPEPDEYIYGAAWIGDFYITQEVLIPLIGTKELSVETFWQDELDESPYWYYFEGDDIYFSSADPDNFKEGDQRISYRGISENDDTVYTIVGMQRDGELYRPDADLGEWIHEGVKSRSELVGGTAKNAVMAIVFFGVLAVLFLVLALWKFEVFEKLSAKKA
jgi:hypothetical protein